MKLGILILGFPFFSTAFASEPVKVCQLGNDESHAVTVIRNAKIAFTHAYYLEYNGELSPLFGTLEQSRGSSVEIACVGSKRHALVMSGEFSANALQGFAMSYSPVTNSLERLDFAEKSSPTWLYLSPKEMVVIVNTLGYGETSSKYRAYHHVAGSSDEAMADAIDQLPASTGFEVIRLRARGKPSIR